MRQVRAGHVPGRGGRDGLQAVRAGLPLQGRRGGSASLMSYGTCSTEATAGTYAKAAAGMPRAEGGGDGEGGACFEEFSRFGRGPTVQGHLVSCRHQMSAHTSPHNARANPTNFCRTRFRRRHFHNYPFFQLNKWSSSIRTTASIQYGSPQTIKDDGFLTISGQNLAPIGGMN